MRVANCASTASASDVRSLSPASSIASEMATWSGASSRVMVTFRPRPDHHHRFGCGHLGEDACELAVADDDVVGPLKTGPSDPSPRRRRPPPRRRSAAATSPTLPLGTAPTPTPTDSAICERGGVVQLLPCLPRPALWCSASSTAPSMFSPSVARASRSALVEPVSSTTSSRRHGRPGPVSLSRSDVARNRCLELSRSMLRVATG